MRYFNTFLPIISRSSKGVKKSVKHRHEQHIKSRTRQVFLSCAQQLHRQHNLKTHMNVTSYHTLNYKSQQISEATSKRIHPNYKTTQKSIKFEN